MDKSIKNPPVERDVCGTYNGATRHRYYNEQNCESCRLAYNAHMAAYQRDYHAKNPEKHSQWGKAKYERNSAKQREAQNRWRAKNMEAERAYAAEWRDANRDKLAEYNRAFRESERGKQASRETSRRRRALKRGNGQEKYTEQEVLYLWGTDCHICSGPIDLTAPRSQATKQPGWEAGLHFDHVVPISKGGSDTLDNVKPAHAKCNLKKSSN